MAKNASNARSIRAPKLNPSTINPLIVDGSPKDTMLAVGEVLAFLSGAMEKAEGDGDNIPLVGGCTGLARILSTCQSALQFHLRDEGGAA